MTATTYTYTSKHAAAVEAGSERGLFRRFLDRMIAGQERRARRLIGQHLATLSTTHLGELGLTEQQITLLRTRGSIG